MESIQAKRKKNKKKKIMVLSGLGMLTVIGSTLAYFTTSDEIVNNFKSGKYQTTIKEDFTSPESWMPGDRVSKTITVTNTGGVPIAVRASYTEKWINAKGEEIPLDDGKGNTAAIINFNNRDWIQDSDGYYYYGGKLAMTKVNPNEETSSFISSVTFNSNINTELKKTVSDDGKTIVYESTKESYDGARYILTAKIDTIQYSASYIW